MFTFQFHTLQHAIKYGRTKLCSLTFFKIYSHFIWIYFFAYHVIQFTLHIHNIFATSRKKGLNLNTCISRSQTEIRNVCLSIILEFCLLLLSLWSGLVCFETNSNSMYCACQECYDFQLFDFFFIVIQRQPIGYLAQSVIFFRRVILTQNLPRDGFEN